MSVIKRFWSNYFFVFIRINYTYRIGGIPIIGRTANSYDKRVTSVDSLPVTCCTVESFLCIEPSNGRIDTRFAIFNDLLISKSLEKSASLSTIKMCKRRYTLLGKWLSFALSVSA